MLYNRFTGPERSRNSRNTALCDWEQTVNNTLSCYKRHIRGQLSLIGTTLTYRPLLHQRNRMLLSLLVCHNGHCIGNRILSAADIGKSAAYANRNHDFLLYHLGLLNRTDDVAAAYLVTHICSGYEDPLLLTLQGGNLHAAVQKVSACFLHNGIQGTLDTVVYTSNQARPQLHAHRYACGFHRLPGSQSGCLLVYLDGSLIAMNLYNFANQTLLADSNHVEHVRVAHAFCDDQRTGYFFNYAFAHLLPPLLLPIKYNIRANCLLH